jgi:hypothetical protein
MGDWSAKHQKYHEPIRGVGWRRLFRKAGFSVFLMDEFCTSRHCPACGHKSLETFLTVNNPRPYRREKTPEVTCHGLLYNCLDAQTKRVKTTAWLGSSKSGTETYQHA